MPMINYKCKEGHISKKLYRGQDILKEVPCKEEECDLMAKKLLGAPNQKSTYTVKQGDLTDVELSHSTIEAEQKKLDEGYANDDEKLRKIY